LGNEKLGVWFFLEPDLLCEAEQMQELLNTEESFLPFDQLISQSEKAPCPPWDDGYIEAFTRIRLLKLNERQEIGTQGFEKVVELYKRFHNNKVRKMDGALESIKAKVDAKRNKRTDEN